MPTVPLPQLPHGTGLAAHGYWQETQEDEACAS